MPRPHRGPMPARLLAAIGLTAALLGTAAAQTGDAAGADTHAGLLKAVQGDVQLQAADGTVVPARIGDPVVASQRILTGPQAGASVVLRDGTTIVVGPQSSFDLQAFRYDPSTHDGSVVGKLLRGTLRMVTGLIGKTRPEAIRIDTPTTVIGIRGTDFIVSAEDRM